MILNFSDRDVDVWIRWPAAGRWTELIDQADSPRPPVQAGEGEWQAMRVSSNYGAIYMQQ